MTPTYEMPANDNDPRIGQAVTRVDMVAIKIAALNQAFGFTPVPSFQPRAAGPTRPAGQAPMLPQEPRP